MTDITQAQAVIAALAAELRDKLKAKGYEKAVADVRIEAGAGAGSRISVVLRTPGRNAFDHHGRQDYRYVFGRTIAEATDEARAVIAEVEDPHAADAWFDPAHPMNRPAVQEAAE